MQIFTIRDSKAEAYMKPFYAENTAVAMRMIQESAMDNASMFRRYPSDFELYMIGKFDEKTGIIKGKDGVNLGRIVDFLQLEMFEDDKK